MSGQSILNQPLLNKGSAFTKRERELFNLCSLLPYQVNTLEEQTNRLQEQYNQLKRPIIKNAFMQNIHDQNETLFYNFILRNLKDILPIIYTPTEGEYIASYSHVFHRPRGVYLNFTESDQLEHVLLEAALQNGMAPKDIDVIVVTDSEEILGIGDQGVGGVAISVTKLVLYTALAGINPARTLPVVLDVGTNNQKLLDDPLYLGWRHERIRGDEYDTFVEQFVDCVRTNFKNAFLHWEDFGVDNARRLLTRYQPAMSTFNDDIQGTGAITLASIMAALKLTDGSMTDQKIVIFGSGTAGIGIADQIRAYLETRCNLSKEEAAKRFWCVDKPGLLTQDLTEGDYVITDQQRVYAHSKGEIKDWKLGNDKQHPQLLDVVKNVKPTVLIGCSTVHGAFTEEIVRAMAEHCDHPIIFPLSNPTRLHEAKPADLFEWTQGKVFVATGSPFDPVEYDGQTYEIAECNNSFVFPGIGLGCIVGRTKHCTDQMIFAAANAISECSPSTKSKDRTKSLLPDINDARHVSAKVATAVVREAIKQGESRRQFEDVQKVVQEFMWEPKYAEYELMQ
ncbi:malate dehydrogenase [Zychaea mexicana]|uniref:malate dehydrogenase n=1 Tax=Zychaea mexicana TaxID=64656 RepID=UPI0022FDB768|nr:malate dehydrogenase [Zychaea mexicana]KAI9492228.1 malate dehydrogenase [Zychaea mexicana]